MRPGNVFYLCLLVVVVSGCVGGCDCGSRDGDSGDDKEVCVS